MGRSRSGKAAPEHETLILSDDDQDPDANGALTHVERKRERKRTIPRTAARNSRERQKSSLSGSAFKKLKLIES
jgi:hypothetical protein